MRLNHDFCNLQKHAYVRMQECKARASVLEPRHIAAATHVDASHAFCGTRRSLTVTLKGALSLYTPTHDWFDQP